MIPLQFGRKPGVPAPLSEFVQDGRDAGRSARYILRLDTRSRPVLSYGHQSAAAVRPPASSQIRLPWVFFQQQTSYDKRNAGDDHWVVEASINVARCRYSLSRDIITRRTLGRKGIFVVLRAIIVVLATVGVGAVRSAGLRTLARKRWATECGPARASDGESVGNGIEVK